MDDFVIAPGMVHLWWARVSAAESDLERLRRTLSSDEIERAGRFRIESARWRFIVARAVLRSVLGRATGVDPADVVFAYGDHGKPRLVNRGPSFNASDSGDYVVVALASAEVGVDLEVFRPLARGARLARRICTQSELETLGSMPDSERDAALLRLWTCKEAALKAIGTGLSGGVKNVEVNLNEKHPPRLVRLCGEIDGWTLLPVVLDPEVACSVVVRGDDWRIDPQPWSFHST